MNGMLEQHINELKEQGHRIEITPEGAGDQTRYFVVFRDHPVPASIWGLDRVDLLLMVPGVYPNAKIDMFWVSPRLSLIAGSVPEGAGTDESYLGRVWQRFSYHPTSWNPAVDSLGSFLELVNYRLHTRH